MLGVTFRGNSRNTTSRGGYVRESFHSTYTDFAIYFCENSRHARIPTHRHIPLQMAEMDRFRECENFLSNTVLHFRHTGARQDWSLDVHVRRRIKRVNATCSK